MLSGWTLQLWQIIMVALSLSLFVQMWGELCNPAFTLQSDLPVIHACMYLIVYDIGPD